MNQELQKLSIRTLKKLRKLNRRNHNRANLDLLKTVVKYKQDVFFDKHQVLFIKPKGMNNGTRPINNGVK
jgi:hypothetical protein